MKDMKIVESHEESGLLIKGVSETIKNEAKEQKGGFLGGYIKYLLILASAITGFLLVSAFASLVGIPIGITSSIVGLKICAMTEGIKKYKSTFLIEKEQEA